MIHNRCDCLRSRCLPRPEIRSVMMYHGKHENTGLLRGPVFPWRFAGHVFEFPERAVSVPSVHDVGAFESNLMDFGPSPAGAITAQGLALVRRYNFRESTPGLQGSRAVLLNRLCDDVDPFFEGPEGNKVICERCIHADQLVEPREVLIHCPDCFP